MTDAIGKRIRYLLHDDSRCTWTKDARVTTALLAGLDGKESGNETGVGSRAPVEEVDFLVISGRSRSFKFELESSIMVRRATELLSLMQDMKN